VFERNLQGDFEFVELRRVDIADECSAAVVVRPFVAGRLLAALSDVAR